MMVLDLVLIKKKKNPYYIVLDPSEINIKGLSFDSSLVVNLVERERERLYPT